MEWGILRIHYGDTSSENYLCIERQGPPTPWD